MLFNYLYFFTLFLFIGFIFINLFYKDKILFIFFILFFIFLWFNKYLNLNFFFYDNWKNLVILFMFILCYIINNLIKEFNFEEWVLSFIVLFGSIVIITCDHFFILYLGLELQTFSLFILISKNKLWLKSSEAGLKYFILGALSSGLFLLGISIIFLSGYSLNIQDYIFSSWYKESILIISSLLIFLSLFFKISLFPLHFWIPDIYEGSSWKIIGLIGSLPKISIIYILIQFKEMTDIFIICSLISIIIGTLGALNQTKIKRLLAYSGISHIGFMILILNIHNQKGFNINNIYLLVYIIGLIAIIILISNLNLSNNNYIIELSSNQFINKIIGLSWIILLLSIAGIPPLSGFISKWLVLWTILEENYIISSILCILFSAIGAAYYIRLIKIIYFQKNSSFVVWKSILLRYNNSNNIININFYFLGLFIFFILFFILKPSPLFLLFNFYFTYIN
uniref:NADH dehydrogenase subunit 2 n=1 Tax=Stephanomia amphytridis TaxID=645353 RepID=UPI0026E1A05C|nr:NADH dehydrogenase subunit 2 [Stephanomia amphytridis]WJJ70200.1 NADH dehydrogenase subunit 2 [Stephanomia amphytridis]